jgi:hypothetical protein
VPLSVNFQVTERSSVLARSRFGLQLGLGIATAVASWLQELGERRRLAGLPAAELIDHDHVLRTASRPPVIGERQLTGIEAARLEHFA